MSYNRVPKEIHYNDIVNNSHSLSASMYRHIIIDSPNVVTMGEIISNYDKGRDPGSQWYLKESNYYMIRTKSLQEFSFLLYPKGESIIPINPKKFVDIDLSPGDILLSKDSNVGECAIVIDDSYNNCVFSGGIVRLHIRHQYNKNYIFAFMKHPIFKEQLNALSPKGATIKHAGDRWTQCLIPFPNQDNREEVIALISKIVDLILHKESMIRKKSQEIYELINTELVNNQGTNSFVYQEPTYQEIMSEGRLDAAIYSNEYKSKISLIENYILGYVTPSEFGFEVIPGPSLEIKLLKTRIDSDVYIENFYSLVLPRNISEYGTLNKLIYLGTRKKLPHLKKGDILFGEAGFQKGRSLVITEDNNKLTTNAHGLYARSKEVNLRDSIYFRCIFDWYRKMRLIDLMAVGGSGGHFSPEYFDYIRIPMFPEELKDRIVSCYYNLPEYKINLSHDTSDYLERDESLGIVQLDAECWSLKKILRSLTDRIIDGKFVDIDKYMIRDISYKNL